tara:strand:+ start:113 stop:571 length:459 start_codon:yes stop_codon:yes gene_type:complete
MIGILKSSINDSDQNFFIANALRQLASTSTQSCLFCDDIQTSKVPVMYTNIFPRIQVFYCNDILITDDLSEAQSLPHIPNAKKRFLYLYHLEWSYIPDLHFNQLQPILLNDDIELIARSDSHAKLISELFKEPKYIMPEWNYKTLIEIDNNE